MLAWDEMLAWHRGMSGLRGRLREMSARQDQFLVILLK